MSWGHDSSSDHALVAAVSQRSVEALREVYHRHGGAVWRVAERVCRSTEFAEDVCQAVFVELWSGPQRFDPSRGDLRSRLVADAHWRAVAVMRSEQARGSEALGAKADPARPLGEADVDVNASALPEEARRAIDKLPAAEREVILLTYFGGPAYMDKVRLRSPDGEFKSRFRQGLANLRRALDAEGVRT